MKVAFKYNLEKDVWCIANKGKASNNSQKPTKIYRQLIQPHGENPTEPDIKKFILAILIISNL